jgi:hypothetical protein
MRFVAHGVPKTMSALDPQVTIIERSEDPCDLCGEEKNVLAVEMSMVKPQAGEFSGNLCWGCLRKSYDDPGLLVALG